MNKYDLEDRLIEFAVELIRGANKFKSMFIAQHLSKQILRSGTSAALNYAEAQSAESRRDFIHKMKLSLKELRETHFCLKIISKGELHNDLNLIKNIEIETNELISIFVKSIQKAKSDSLN